MWRPSRDEQENSTVPGCVVTASRARRLRAMWTDFAASPPLQWGKKRRPSDFLPITVISGLAWPSCRPSRSQLRKMAAAVRQLARGHYGARHRQAQAPANNTRPCCSPPVLLCLLSCMFRSFKKKSIIIVSLAVSQPRREPLAGKAPSAGEAAGAG